RQTRPRHRARTRFVRLRAEDHEKRTGLQSHRGGRRAAIHVRRRAMKRLSVWGAHAPSRAGLGAFTQTIFFLLAQRQDVRRRGRRRQHARARALPRICLSAIILLLSELVVRSVDAITLDAALSRTLEKNPEIVQARLALEQA